MVQPDQRMSRFAPTNASGASSGAAVYLSDFGPMKHPWFPLWWDMLVVAAFSLGIFFWAMRVALPAEKIERMVRGAEPEPSPVLERAA